MIFRFAILCYLTLLGLLIAPILSLAVSDTCTSGLYSQVIIFVFLVVSAFYPGVLGWKKPDREFFWLKAWLFFYLLTSAINNLVIDFRPSTFAQMLVSWGVVFLLARRIKFPYLYEIFFGFFILMFFISVAFFFLGITHVGVLPTYESGNLSVNLGYAVSKHFTGLLGFVLFAFSFERYMNMSRGKMVWAGLLLGVYFAILSSSRAFALAVIIFPAFYMFSLKKSVRTWWPIPITWFVVSFLIFAPLIFENIGTFLPMGLSSFLGLDRGFGTEEAGIYSGREWLWLIHFELFQSNWLSGIGKFNLQDLLPLTILPASTESFFTYMLARDGLFSIFNIFIFSSLLSIAWKYKNHFGFALAVCLLLFAATLGLTTNLYSFEAFFLYCLYFSSFNGAKFTYERQS